MNIKVAYGTFDSLDSWEQMFIDGKDELFVTDLSECPEDAIIGRDLVSCQKVVQYMIMAYEAGKRGELLKVEVKKEDEPV